MTALKKTIKLFVIIFSVLVYFLFPLAEVLATDTDLNDQVEEEEEERKVQLRALLELDLPTETDNPNYQIVFTEPEDTDVEIKIDDGGYVTKKSPYSLPSLSIGRHAITFKFEDVEGVEQTLAEILIVLPRAPVFSESEDLSFDSSDDIVFSGTALPNSTAVFLISSDLVMQLITVDSDGNWTLAIDEDLGEGNHQIVGFVRKDGYASDFSDPVTFYVGSAISSELEAGESESAFSLNLNINWGEIFSEDNKYYFIGAGGVVLLIVLVIIGSSMKAGAENGKDVEKFIKTNEDGNEVTLREKLTSGSPKKSKETKQKKGDKKGASSTDQGLPTQGAEPTKDEVIEKEKEEKSVKEKDKQAVEEKPKQKKGFFSFLKFGKPKSDSEKKYAKGEDVKKVVSKEEFIEDYKEDASTSSAQDETKLTKEFTKGGDKQVKKQKSKKPKDKQVDKKSKSNKIEVTLT